MRCERPIARHRYRPLGLTQPKGRPEQIEVFELVAAS
jgi:hypothetical protein